jgi:hypothetical protein
VGTQQVDRLFFRFWIRAACFVTAVLTSDAAGIVCWQAPKQLVWVHDELTAFLSLPILTAQGSSIHLSKIEANFL